MKKSKEMNEVVFRNNLLETLNEVLDGKVSGDEVREASKSNDKDVSDIARKTAEILKAYTLTIASMDLKIINVIIDKTKFRDDQYQVLENALKYNIQRIDNDSNGEWNYLIITDKGRLAPMRKTARAIRAYNPIQSKYSYEFTNQPISNLIEDILEKDSAESYFIQISDFISYFVHLYYEVHFKGKKLPNRVMNVIDAQFVGRVMATLKSSDKLNLKANEKDHYGFVIYPK